jgi:hypothetical protein
LGFLLAFLIGPGPAAFAHDPKYHKKHFIEGEVLDTSSSGFTMKTAKGTTTVAANAGTVFEAGKDGHPAALKDVQKEDKVSVSGTTLESGELVAKEVLIKREVSAGSSAADGSQK